MKDIRKWVVGFAIFFVSANALSTIGQYAVWYFGDRFEATGFVLFGIGVLLGTSLYPNIRARLIFSIGVLIWSASVFLISAYYLSTQVHRSFLSSGMDFAFIASIPLLLLGVSALICSWVYGDNIAERRTHENN